MVKSTKVYGLIPEDLLVGGAISKALEDIRKSPFLLDYCFNWLAMDPLTKNMYGEKEKARIKEWFKNTMIYVSPSTLRMDDVKFPLISIHLETATTDAETLGDVHYDTSEEIPSEDSTEIQVQPNIILAGATPKTFDSATGTIILAEGKGSRNIVPGMIYVDNSNKKGYPILEVLSDESFTIDKGVSANFTNAYIAPIDTFMVASLESIVMKQTYSIKVFIQNDPQQLMYLSTIIRFILYRYKELLLEDRGFERSTFMMTGPQDATGMFPSSGDGEFVFSQMFTLTGFVRESWPKAISPTLQGITIHGLEFITGTQSPSSLLTTLENQGWWGSEDPLPND